MSFALISTTTVGAGGVASVTFSGIPATFTDLVLIGSARYSTTGYVEELLCVRFNGDSTYGNYSSGQLMNQVGTATKNYTSLANKMDLAYITGGNLSSNYFGNFKMEIPFYSSTSNTKSAHCEWAWSRNASTASNGLGGGGWTGTAAIDSITLVPFATLTIAQNSVFSLYGRTKGSGGATVS
jgi:hypothetical protein